jgi:hypothetical protein
MGCAQALFLTFIKKYKEKGVTENNAVDWLQFGPKGEVVLKEDHWKNPFGWHLHAKVRKTDCDYEGKYLPFYLTAYHEILHVEDIPPFGDRTFFIPHTGTELLQTIKTIILADEVYKQINEKGIDSEIDYGKSIMLKNKTISIGAIANFYRKLEQRHDSLCEGIISSTSIEFLNKN